MTTYCLGLTNAADEVPLTTILKLDSAQIKDIGKRVANQAINLFKEAGTLLDYVDSSKSFVFTTTHSELTSK